MCWCGVEIEGEGRRTEDGGRRQASIEEEGDDDDGIMDLKKKHTTDRRSALSTYAPVRSWPGQPEPDKGRSKLKDNPCQLAHTGNEHES